VVDVVSSALVIATVVGLPVGMVGWLKLRRRNLALDQMAPPGATPQPSQ
jgi:hypothetical protein